MTPQEVEALANRILAAIRHDVLNNGHGEDRHHAADRERVASDLAGLLAHLVTPDAHSCYSPVCPDTQRYAEGLRRTAALYGVEQ